MRTRNGRTVFKLDRTPFCWRALLIPKHYLWFLGTAVRKSRNGTELISWVEPTRRLALEPFKAPALLRIFPRVHAIQSSVPTGLLSPQFSGQT